MFNNVCNDERRNKDVRQRHVPTLCDLHVLCDLHANASTREIAFTLPDFFHKNNNVRNATPSP